MTTRKIEILVLIPNHDSFCNTKKSFVDFLCIDQAIKINGRNLTYTTSSQQIAAKIFFDVSTGNIPSNKERYFIITLSVESDELIDALSELSNNVIKLCTRINPDYAVVNVLWDDTGKHYALLSYPLISDTENMMRNLISKFMSINLGINWTEETVINEDFGKKIERVSDEKYLNDLYKLDFADLTKVLTNKRRYLTTEALDRILSKGVIGDAEKLDILKYAKKSIWETYFSDLIEVKQEYLENKWNMLYKLRNKVAHNRFITNEEYKKIRNLSEDVNKIIEKALGKLNLITINEEERELIIHDLTGFSEIEKAVAEYYINAGFDILSSDQNFNNHEYIPDLILGKDGKEIYVEIKELNFRTFNRILNGSNQHLEKFISLDKKPKEMEKKLILILPNHVTFPASSLNSLRQYSKEQKHNFSLELGTINAFNEYIKLNSILKENYADSGNFIMLRHHLKKKFSLSKIA